MSLNGLIERLYLITVLYWCVNLLMYYCIGVLVYCCISVLMYYCVDVLIYWCINVLLHWCRYWLFSRYSTGWKCGLHADYTELTECLQAGKLEELEGLPSVGSRRCVSGQPLSLLSTIALI